MPEPARGKQQKDTAQSRKKTRGPPGGREPSDELHHFQDTILQDLIWPRLRLLLSHLSLQDFLSQHYPLCLCGHTPHSWVQAAEQAQVQSPLHHSCLASWGPWIDSPGKLRLQLQKRAGTQYKGQKAGSSSPDWSQPQPLCNHSQVKKSSGHLAFIIFFSTWYQRSSHILQEHGILEASHTIQTGQGWNDVPLAVQILRFRCSARYLKVSDGMDPKLKGCPENLHQDCTTKHEVSHAIQQNPWLVWKAQETCLFPCFCGNWPFFQMPSILSKKGDKIKGSNLLVIKRVVLKCVVHMHFSSETFLTHYLQHAYVLPIPLPPMSHTGPCRLCVVNVLWSLFSHTIPIGYTKPKGQDWKAIHLGQHILKTSSYE